VEKRSVDPAASLAQYFSLLSKRNGELTKISARRVLNSEAKLAVEVSVECFFNGGTRTACTTIGEPVHIQAPALAEGEEEVAEEEGTPDEQLKKLVDSTIENLNTVVGPALVGIHATATRDCDYALKALPSAPAILASLAVAEAGAHMKQLPVYLFVAQAVEELLKQGETALGGGHLAEVPSADQMLNEEERPSPDAPEPEPAGGEEGEEDEEKFVPQGLPLTLPVVMLPAFSCGPTLDPASKVRMRKFWIMTKRDAALNDAIPAIIKTYRELKTVMEAKAAEAPPPDDGAETPATRLADDDGFFLAPMADNVSDVLGYIEAAVGAAGLAYGDDIMVCCNMGAQDFYTPNTGENTYFYRPDGEGEDIATVEADAWADWVCQFLDSNPAISAIEDVAGTDDYPTWGKVRLAVEARSEKVTILGSDLFNDDPDLFRAGVAEGWADGVVMRPEKLGTVTDVLDNATMFTALAPPARALRVVLAHRPGPRAGEVEADLAVGIGAWGIKSGMPGHATMGKLNRLILIEEQLAHMDKAARAGAEPQLQTAHLRKWEQVYATEAAAAQQYAEAAELAAQGP